MTDWVLTKALNKEDIVGFGDVFFSPISMKTLTTVIDQCISDHALGVFNTGSGGSLSKYEFIQEFLHHVGINDAKLQKMSIEQFDNFTQRPKNMSMNSEKLYSTLKLSPFDLGKELKTVAEDYSV